MMFCYQSDSDICLIFLYAKKLLFKANFVFRVKLVVPLIDETCINTQEHVQHNRRMHPTGLGNLLRNCSSIADHI